MKYSSAVAVLVTLSFARATSVLPIRRVRYASRHLQVLNFLSIWGPRSISRLSPVSRRWTCVTTGLLDWTYGLFEQIRDHEATQVTFLSTALTTDGAQAVAPCEYSFPITDVKLFVNFGGTVVEAVGTAAYTGGAHLIDDKDYRTVAASILAVEARHEDTNMVIIFPTSFYFYFYFLLAWINSAVKRSVGRLVSDIYSLAVPFIKSCPASNTASLPALTACLALTVTDAHRTPRLSPYRAESLDTTLCGIHFWRRLRGFGFCVVTNDGGLADDSTTVAGPAFVNFAFDSRGRRFDWHLFWGG
ncbi:ferritin-like domain-containing protein [Mycena capillaripes]|nr:ferritin-like domain-containing protein [Mycena capillaripes]